MGDGAIGGMGENGVLFIYLILTFFSLLDFSFSFAATKRKRNKKKSHRCLRIC
jgi:hypothetical protein